MPVNSYESYEIERDESGFRLHYHWTRRDYVHFFIFLAMGFIPLILSVIAYLRFTRDGDFISIFLAGAFLYSFTALGVYREIWKRIGAPRRNILHFNRKIEFLYLPKKGKRIAKADVLQIEYELKTYKIPSNIAGFYRRIKPKYEVLVFLKTRDKQRIKLFSIPETAVPKSSPIETKESLLTLTRDLCNSLSSQLGITDKQIQSSKLKP